MPFFSDRLRAAMDLRNYSNEKLAGRISVSRQAVSGYLNGKCYPSLETLVEISKALVVPSDYLLGLSEAPIVDSSSFYPLPSLPSRIEYLRIEMLHLSQPEFAEKLGMDSKKGRSTINNWESGANRVKDDDLKNIAETFHVSADWLLGLSEIITRDPDSFYPMRFIAEYTGLPERAISALHNAKGNE